MKRERGIFVILALTVLVVELVNPRFLSVQNISDLLVQIAQFAILSTGLMCVILLGEIDISVGSLAGLLSAILGLLVSSSHAKFDPILAILVMVSVGVAGGYLNGLLVTKAKIPSIIATLGMMTIYRGTTEALLGGQWVKDIPESVRFWGTGKLLGVPVPIVVSVIWIALVTYLLSQTPFGRRLFACGSNAHSAELRGLPINRIKLIAFVILGLSVSLTTLVTAPQLSVIESGFGTSWELFVVTCVIVGGVQVQGGQGSVVGVLLAVMLLSLIRTALIFLKLGDQAIYWERTIQGALIVGAVSLDRVSHKKSKGAPA